VPLFRTSLVVAILLLAGCGSEAGTGTSTTAATTTSQAATTTAPISTTSEPTTTLAPQPTAADSLAAFFAAAEALDASIKEAAAAFNAGFDDAAGTLDPSVEPMVNALDAVPLGDLIPPGLSSELETVVLAVFTDLDSRIAALAGGMRYLGYPDLTGALSCLSGGGDSAARFPGDLAAARALAAQQAAPTASADSEAAGILAVRLTAIHSMNWGCDSCGGLVYDVPIEVDWAGRTVGGGVQFDAEFSGGAWHIVIMAC
jgi:hypothetical protein